MNRARSSPLITFALFSYNQEKFIRSAVQGALGQRYENIHFIFSDDCSSDRTFQIMSSTVAEHKGEHSVVLNRNAANLGLSQHFSKIVSMAEGEFLVIAAGDDISLPDRVADTVNMLTSAADINFASFVDDVIDDEGVVVMKRSGQMKSGVLEVTLDDYLKGRNPPLSGASRGYRLSALRKYGALKKECPTEDTPSVLRCLMLGRGLVSSKGGIFYRRHDTNLSGAASLHAMPFEGIRVQYLSDLEMAKASGFVSASKADGVHSWIEKNYRRRLLSRGLYHAVFWPYYFLTKVAPSKDFTVREKVGMLRETVRRGRS